MIYGIMATSIISYYLNSYYAGVLIKYPFREQVLDLFPYLGISALMGATVFAAGLLRFQNNWSLLLIQIAAGFIVYAGLCRIFRLTAFMDVWQSGWVRIKASKFNAAKVQGFK